MAKQMRARLRRRHTSIAGSGTKLALEDAIELANSLKGASASLEQSLAHYEAVRSVEVLKNAEQTGEFVWNLVTRPLAERMNMTSADVPPDVDEFSLACLTAVPSRLIGVPRVGGG